MSTTDDLLAEINNTLPGPSTLALFDFDGTIIAGYSSLFILREQLRRGDITKHDFARVVLAIINHQLGLMDDHGLMELGASFLKGSPVQEFSDLCEHVYETQLNKRIYPEARALIAAHRARGHIVAIASSAPEQAISLVAQQLQIDHIASSHYVVDQDQFTGTVTMPVCWGFGKRLAAEKLASQLNCSLDNAFFYTDSDEDLPLLEVVGHPTAVNPNPRLKQHADFKDWFSVDFKPRRWRLRELGGTAGVYISLVASYLGGLGVAHLEGDRKRGRGFMLKHFTDSVCKLIGMDIELINEHYLRDNPASVVIFNHQSNADGFIILKLLRENYAGIGKRAFGKVPLLSDAYEFAGVIPIDRDDSKSAIASMAPLIEAITKEGRSVAVAPEGTRSSTRKPGPFKKGAFHLALDAKVNIVPVVIHNSLNVQTKGDSLYHSAKVTVEILPPIDTSHWKRAELDTHIADVRQQYLQALGFTSPEPSQVTAAPLPAAKKSTHSPAQPTPIKRTPRIKKATT
ncbi:MAG: HAD-IB family hydrolase [Zhongshania sp.]|uniref:HAD-IB family hydrolase n=1 Tax=Zhongshania sp. TaxID=1971902 RepID=UPI00262D8D51|nr:HAD-IB family hydrolase [Zhongshania sp.]MDF1690820.1 HAD-IB family hydrolase [Zhongshania sp.]